MSVRIILNPRAQNLRLSCGQCGDTKDITLSIDPDKKDEIEIEIFDTEELINEEYPEMLREPIHIIV